MDVEAYRAHPPTWWRFLRVSLDQFGIKKLTAEQQALAETFVADIQIKPFTAALKIASLTHDVTTERLPNGWKASVRKRVR